MPNSYQKGEFKEKDFRFFFDVSSWEVEKYDARKTEKDIATCFYRETLEPRMQKTKAIDFLARHETKNMLLFLEVKDFRKESTPDFRIGKKSNLYPVLAQKVRDTVAGICGALHSRPNEPIWGRFSEILVNRKAEKRLVFFLQEQDSTEEESRDRSKRGKQERDVFENKLKAKLSWFSSHVHVCNKDNYDDCVPALRVEDMATS